MAENISVFPNPTTGKIKIMSNDIIKSVKIYNMLGELIFSNPSINQMSTNIDVSNTAKGICILKMETTTETVNRKIIVR